MKIYLIRHAESTANEKDILSGVKEVKLTKKEENKPEN